MKNLIASSLASAIALSLVCCKDKGPNVPVEKPSDYSVADNWLHVPSATDKAVDVFFLYPTAWSKVSPLEPNICPIDNPSMRFKAPLIFTEQGTAFETAGNIYAPFYRQIDVEYASTLPIDQFGKLTKGIPYLDAVAAFEYYLANYNNGRPFILAGHSQGSNVLLHMLSEYMKAKPQVYARMVAAYLIGYSVTQDFMDANPHLRFATGASDVGVIISYNTEAPGLTALSPVVLDGAISINPLSWTRTGQIAEVSLNIGSRGGNFADGYERVAGFANARVNTVRGVVECSTVDIDLYSLPGNIFPRGAFHSSDYAFYYYNLRQNAEERAAAYLAAHP